MRGKTLEPSKLVIKFRPWLRIAVRQVDRGNEHALHSRLDVPALGVGGIARQLRPRDDRVGALREDRNAIPALLSAPRRAVARRLKRVEGKAPLLAL